MLILFHELALRKVFYFKFHTKISFIKIDRLFQNVKAFEYIQFSYPNIFKRHMEMRRETIV